MSVKFASFTRRQILAAGLCGSVVWTACASKNFANESLDQQVANHAEQLRRKLDGSDFQLVIEGPFVVIGDEAATRVQQRAAGTLRWAYDHLRREYLRTTPQEPIVVWICRDAASYERTSRQQLNIEPESPFGFYAPDEKTILVNIATGSGTLVHELVHSLLAVDFADCPPWFNEGLASLYEQCDERDGRIWGLPNWRLRGLQKTIADNRLITFEQLCHHGSDRAFLTDSATAYAQSRYLCLYLQEQGLLQDFYRTFRDQHLRDPTGYRTLVSVLGNPDMTAFHERWKQWAQSLREK